MMMGNYVQKYKVYPLEQKVRKQVIDYVPRQVQTGEVELANGKTEKQFKIVRERVMREVVVDGGYLVVMARGDSIRVKDEAELRRLGFAGEAPLVDAETGEEVPQRLFNARLRVPIASLVGNIVHENEEAA